MTGKETTNMWWGWLKQVANPDSQWGCLLLPAGVLTFLGLMTLPLIAIVIFIALQSTSSAPAAPPPITAVAFMEAIATPTIDLPTATPILPPAIITPVVAADLPAYAPEAVAAGEAAYASLCTACHGPDARGLPNLGKDLVDSEFVRSQSDRELQQFIIMGRPIWDPANTTGVDMPPRGGNPALSNEDILNIIAYLRSLQSTP
ncbi:MAG: cytochrome c [Anaerolineae bacterium]|nr:cytochrome c [Anaerolineae bacterium]